MVQTRRESQWSGKPKPIIFCANCKGEKKSNNMLKSLCKADALLAPDPSRAPRCIPLAQPRLAKRAEGFCGGTRGPQQEPLRVAQGSGQAALLHDGGCQGGERVCVLGGRCSCVCVCVCVCLCACFGRKVLWLCPTALKVPSCPSRAGAARAMLPAPRACERRQSHSAGW